MHTLGKLAKLVSGEAVGDPSFKVRDITALAVVREGAKNVKAPAIIAKDPRRALAKILVLFAPPCEVEEGIHKTAVVHKTAKLGKNVRIGALSYVGPNAEIGDRTILYPQVTIYARSVIGKNCILHGGVRIGLDGYGFVPVGGKFEKIPQIGRAVIEDDVEIYANSCVARGTIGDTIIRRGVKIDTLTHIAHNCEIGEDCAITSLVGFAGSVKLGKHVTVGGQAGFAGHLEVGDNTVIMGRAGVTKNIPANAVVSGFPAIDHRKDMETQAYIRKLSRRGKPS